MHLQCSIFCPEILALGTNCLFSLSFFSLTVLLSSFHRNLLILCYLHFLQQLPFFSPSTVLLKRLLFFLPSLALSSHNSGSDGWIQVFHHVQITDYTQIVGSIVKVHAIFRHRNYRIISPGPFRDKMTSYSSPKNVCPQCSEISLSTDKGT